MRTRIYLAAVAVVLAAILVAGTVSTALASSWSDLPDSLLDQYGITSNQVAQISNGFPNGLWRPNQQITRAQFVKMACLALGIAQTTPATPTFTDVPRSSTFYSYIEGAAAAGLVNGVSARRFAPDAYVTREQGLAIIARGVAMATSQNLSTLYTDTQISTWLAGFTNGSAVSPSLKSAVVFAANLNIVRSSEGDLNPRGWLTRLQAATFLVRAGAPTVASITPGQGSYTGGNTVTITGTGFIDATAVKFGAKAALSFTVVSDTQITAVVPEGTAGETVNVVVTNLEGSSDVWEVTYTYTHGVPTVTSISPNNGSPGGGNTAIITGTGFTDATAVQFGGVDATSFKVESDTRITAVVPAGPPGDAVEVSVTGPEGTSAPNSCWYAYNNPSITSISPNHGPAAGGNMVTMTGSGFSVLPASGAIRFGSANALSYTVLSDTSLTAVVPAGKSGRTVGVTIAFQGVNWSMDYTYDTPQITGITPDSGTAAGGNSVIISGIGFTDATGVLFGAIDAKFNVESDTRIRVTVPAFDNSGGGPTDDRMTVNVTVVAFDGTAVCLTDAYKYTWGKPTVDSVTPNSGPTADDTQVTIIGTNFSKNDLQVWFVGDSGTYKMVFSSSEITYYSSTKIKVYAPSDPGLSAGDMFHVLVHTYWDDSDPTSADWFTYN